MAQDYRKPIAGKIPQPSKRPVTGDIPPPAKWSFSMQYWRQIDYFGLGNCERSWFISMLKRLADISTVNLEDFFNNYRIQDTYRFHSINWNQFGIPIKKRDLSWLGEQINAEDFELVQFQVSTGTGRIIGFFDSSRIFNIVLFDPSHNLQPADRFDYRVQATHISECQLSKLTARFQNVITSHSDLSQNQKIDLLSKIDRQYGEFTSACIMLDISSDCLEKIYTLAASGALLKMGEIIESAVDDLSK